MTSKILLFHPSGMVEVKNYTKPLNKQFRPKEYVRFEIIKFPKLKGILLFVEELPKTQEPNLIASELVKANVYGHVIVSRDGKGLTEKDIANVIDIIA